MRVTVADAVRAYPALVRIASEKQPQKPAWRLATWIDLLRPLVERHNRQRNDIIMEQGQVNANGEWEVKPNKESQDAYRSAYDALLGEDQDLDYNPIPLSLFKRIVREDGKDVEKLIELSGNDLGLARKFFADDAALSA